MPHKLAISGILETVLYCSGENETETRHFYENVLGLRPVGLGGGGFRVGPHQMLLLFDRERSAVQDDPPPHGATGPVHACFVVPADQYESWKERLAEAGVVVSHETKWKDDVKSFYFDDPAGNVLEIANGDLWPE